MAIRIIRKRMTQQELLQMAEEGFGDMVKGVVDVKQKIVALGGELHADAEALLLEEDSEQSDLWGFNIYPSKPKNERIEFSSFINIRPSQGNRSMEIKDEALKEQITKIIDGLIES